MAGATDYTATNILNWLTGQLAMPALPPLYLGLFTTAPTSDSGVTGATEVTGGAYARIQIAGPLTTNGTTASGNDTLHFASVPAWITTGMSIRDVTAPSVIQANTTVLTKTGTTVVMSATATGAGVGGTDSIVFSAFTPPTNSAGAEPGTTAAFAQNNSIVTFAQATASWGTAVAFGIFDALTTGNCLAWDWLGNYKWIPFTMTFASPGVVTTDSTSAYANSTSVVMTAKYGTGVFPTTGGSLAGILTTAGLSGATFNVGVNTTGAGEGLIRQVLQQPIAINVTMSFAVGQLVISNA